MFEKIEYILLIENYQDPITNYEKEDILKYKSFGIRTFSLANDLQQKQCFHNFVL
jgi:hypothetical protein